MIDKTSDSDALTMLNLPRHVYESWEVTGFTHSWMSDNGLNTKILEQLKSRLKLDKIVLAKALDIGDELVLIEWHEIEGQQRCIEKVARVSKFPFLLDLSIPLLPHCFLPLPHPFPPIFSTLPPPPNHHKPQTRHPTNPPPSPDNKQNPLPRPHPPLLHQWHLPSRAPGTTPQSQGHPPAVHET